MGDGNVQHFFSMDRARFETFLAQLHSLDKPASYLLSELNIRLSKPDRSASCLRTGAALLVLSIAALAISVRYGTSGSLSILLNIIFVVGAGAGLRRIYRGVRQRRQYGRMRAEALAMQQTLEGDDGFLWRFEPMLQDWDHDLPPEVRESLPATCLASKAGNLGDSLEQLRTYWYWASACEGRMSVAKAEMRW
jgi:hypothetical protein